MISLFLYQSQFNLLGLSLLASTYSVPPPGCVLACDLGSNLYLLLTAAALSSCVCTYTSPFLSRFLFLTVMEASMVSIRPRLRLWISA